MFNEMERKTGIAYCSLIKGMAKVSEIKCRETKINFQ